jgi:hypothetical protein
LFGHRERVAQSWVSIFRRFSIARAGLSSFTELRMKFLNICRAILILTGCVFAGACASHDEAKGKSGHWVTMPSETGTMIQRRVWVEDGDESTNGPTMGNVQKSSAAGLERAQRNTHMARPPGS